MTQVFICEFTTTKIMNIFTNTNSHFFVKSLLTAPICLLPALSPGNYLFSSTTTSLEFLNFYINGIVQDIFFFVWLPSLSIIILKFIQIIARWLEGWKFQFHPPSSEVQSGRGLEVESADGQWLSQPWLCNEDSFLVFSFRRASMCHQAGPQAPQGQKFLCSGPCPMCGFIWLLISILYHIL